MEEFTEHSSMINLITRFLAHETNAEEAQQLQDWIAKDPENKRLFEEYRQSWDATGQAKQLYRLDLEAEWERMETVIDEGEEKIVPIQRNPMQMITRIAAVILVAIIGFGGIYFWIQQSQNTIVAAAEVNEETLPDGSYIALNRNSALTFTKSFGEKHRKVRLLGEAFFEVKKDTTKPFIIDAGPVLIEVLGTSFYVNANDASDDIEVVVSTGKVSVVDKKNKKRIILDPGNRGVFSKSAKTLNKTAVKDVNYLAWKTRKMIFKNKRLQHIVNTLNKVYNKPITITAKHMRNCRLTVTFDQQSLDEILTVLEATMDLTVDRQESGITISGEGC